MTAVISRTFRQLGILLLLGGVLLGVASPAGLASACGKGCPCCGPTCDGRMCGMRPGAMAPGSPRLEAPERSCAGDCAVTGAGRLSVVPSTVVKVFVSQTFSRPLPEDLPSSSFPWHSPRQPRAPPSGAA